VKVSAEIYRFLNHFHFMEIFTLTIKKQKKKQIKILEKRKKRKNK